jgi:hypothetical protein
VTLHGDVAWVQVVTDKARERRVRFYRWTERGWVHAPPDPAFWGEPTVWQYERLLVQATAKDRPHGEILAAHIWEVAQAVCGALDCPDDMELSATFVPDAVGPLPRLSSQGLLLPSPWLTGIPVGKATPGSHDGLDYWTVYYVAALAIDGLAPGNLSPAQAAILAEYASFHAAGNLDTAPILRRVVDRQGPDALPALLHTLGDASNLSDILPYWLALSAGMPDTFFGLLVDIAQDPGVHTCQEVFGLLTGEEAVTLTKWLETHQGWSACAAHSETERPEGIGGL